MEWSVTETGKMVGGAGSKWKIESLVLNMYLVDAWNILSNFNEAKAYKMDN